jgi:uncharacterized delta-60 repeat protein
MKILLKSAALIGWFTATCFSAPAAGVHVLGAQVLENQPSVHFQVIRDGESNTVQMVDYFTRDDTALAGTHYRASTGTVVFAVGQSVANVEVALIDNGLLEGDKSFDLLLTNARPNLIIYSDAGLPPLSPCGGWTWPRGYAHGFIKDNELAPTRLDSLFVPDRWADGFASPMPDGRVAIFAWDGVLMLQSNGWVDLSFGAGGGTPHYPIALLPQGRILASEGEERFVVLSPNGAVETVLNPPTTARFKAAQSDGKILMSSYEDHGTETLFRMNVDGSVDDGFIQSTFTPSSRGLNVAAPDAKILVAGRNGLVRLHSDGSLDTNFLAYAGEVLDLFVRSNGKIIITRGGSNCCETAQLHADGQLDPTFNAEWLFSPMAEQPDGRLLRWTEGQLIRLNTDGSWDTNFNAQIRGMRWCGPGRDFRSTVAVDSAGGILFSGFFDQVGGFLRRGLARLLPNLPEPEFRVFTPAEFYRSSRMARIQVVRTGPTTNAASVSFATSDATAKAGVDYVARTGTLDFAPLEVNKEVNIQLLNGTGSVDRVTFNLELSSPGIGYNAAPATPVVIFPDLRLGAPRLTNGSVALTLEGTVPGLNYWLQNSSQLPWDWVGISGARASGASLSFTSSIPSDSAVFFRAHRE